MTVTRTDLPPHIAHQATKVFGLVRSRLAQERLLVLQQVTGQAADEVRRAVVQLRALADASDAGSRTAQVARELEAAATGLDQLAEDLRRPFLIFVVGMGKFGKSTLINALLGQRVADMDALPKTWKIDVYTHTLPAGVAEVRTYQGKVERFSVAEARRLITEEERRREESENKVWELFQEQARKLTSVAEKEVLRRELETLYLYRSPIVEVKWPVPTGGITRYFDVVDTPGLWQERPERRWPAGETGGCGDAPPGPSSPVHASLGGPTPGESANADSQSFSLVSSEDLRSYYLQADGVLWMLDATKLAAGKPHELMNDLNAALHRIGGVARNAVAVLNRIDLVRRNGGEDAVGRVVRQAQSLLAGLFRHVIPVSAREALEAQEAGDGERLQASGLPHLLTVIHQEFRAGGADVRWWSKSEGRYQYLLQVQAVSRKYRQELTEAETALKKRAAEAQRHLNALKRTAQGHFEKLLTEYKTDVSSQLWDKVPELLKLRDEERYRYLRDEVYQLPALKAVLENLFREVEQQYRKAVDELVPLQRFTAFRYADSPPLPSVIARFSPQDYRLDLNVEAGDPSKTAGMVIHGAASLLGASLLGPVGLLIGPLVSNTLFGGYLSSMRESQVRTNLRNQLDELGWAVEEQFREAVLALDREARRHLKKVREISFAHIHVPASKVGEARDVLQSLEAIIHRPVPEPEVSRLTLVPWVRHWAAGH